MNTEVSSLSLTAGALYLFVVIATLAAAATAKSHRQQVWHLRSWLLLAVLFGLLIALRLLDAEEVMRENLRAFLRADSTYASRRSFQGPLSAGLIAVFCIVSFAWIYKVGRRINGKRNIAVAVAVAGGFAMIFLISLRMVSLHTVDSFLYGPLKLNWVADLGLTCLAGGAACAYIGRVFRR